MNDVEYELSVVDTLARLRPDLIVSYEYPGFVHLRRDDSGYVSLAFSFNTPNTWEWAWFVGDESVDGDDIPGVLEPGAVARAVNRVLASLEI